MVKNTLNVFKSKSNLSVQDKKIDWIDKNNFTISFYFYDYSFAEEEDTSILVKEATISETLPLIKSRSSQGNPSSFLSTVSSLVTLTYWRETEVKYFFMFWFFLLTLDNEVFSTGGFGARLNDT